LTFDALEHAVLREMFDVRYKSDMWLAERDDVRI
jgi:hypothetical protein